MPERFHVIVVGAGPAGSMAAFRLANEGASVLVLDRQRFPRDKPCGGGVTIRGARLLPFPSIPSSNASSIASYNVTMGHHGPRRDVTAGAPLILMTQRRRLDHFLVEQAVAAGAEFRYQARVRTIAVAPDGVRVETESGPIAAEVLVGADGANGVTRAALGAPAPSFAIALEGNLPRGAAWFDDAEYQSARSLNLMVPGGYGWIFPKGDHCNFGVGGYLDEGPRLREHLAELCAAHGFLLDELTQVRGHRLPIRRAGRRWPRRGRCSWATRRVSSIPSAGTGCIRRPCQARSPPRPSGRSPSGRSHDLSAYPARLGAALEPHVASAGLQRRSSSIHRGRRRASSGCRVRRGWSPAGCARTCTCADIQTPCAAWHARPAAAPGAASDCSLPSPPAQPANPWPPRDPQRTTLSMARQAIGKTTPCRPLRHTR